MEPKKHSLMQKLIAFEQRAMLFYKNLAKHAKHDDDIAFFIDIAADEEKHIDLYTEYENVLSESGLRISDADNSYLCSIIDGKFEDIANETFTKSIIRKGRLHVYELAEEVERTAIFFVLELKECCNLDSKIISSVLTEEREHFKKISTKKIEVAQISAQSPGGDID